MGEIKFPIRLFVTVVSFILMLVFTSITGIIISKNISSRVEEGRSVLNKIKKVENPGLEEINKFMKVTLCNGSRG